MQADDEVMGMVRELRDENPDSWTRLVAERAEAWEISSQRYSQADPQTAKRYEERAGQWRLALALERRRTVPVSS